MNCAGDYQRSTSEEESFPVESAPLLGETRGWRAGHCRSSNNPPSLRPAAKAEAYIAGF
jgi:hypothetical protein